MAKTTNTKTWVPMSDSPSEPLTGYEAAEEIYYRLAELYEKSVSARNPDYEILEALEAAENAAGRVGGVDPTFWDQWITKYAPLGEQ